MTDEQTAAEIVAAFNSSKPMPTMQELIVRALQQARKEGGKQVVDEAERVSQILQSVNTSNSDNEAKARFEVDRFAFACAGSIVGSTLTDYQKHALFHQFKNVFDSHDAALRAARESALDTHANAAVLRMCHEARMCNGIVDYSDPNATGVVRRVLRTVDIGKYPSDQLDRIADVLDDGQRVVICDAAEAAKEAK